MEQDIRCLLGGGQAAFFLAETEGRAVGFREANRIICFVKSIGEVR